MHNSDLKGHTSIAICTPLGFPYHQLANVASQLNLLNIFFLDCKLYDDARVQLFTKLDGLLEKRVSSYTKNNLCEILLSGEKPQIPDKYQHNKFIFYAVQRFICKTKRLYFIQENKPINAAAIL